MAVLSMIAAGRRGRVSKAATLNVSSASLALHCSMYDVMELVSTKALVDGTSRCSGRDPSPRVLLRERIGAVSAYGWSRASRVPLLSTLPRYVVLSRAVQAGIALAAPVTNITAAFGKIE